jgi:hypothetical protein
MSYQQQPYGQAPYPPMQPPKKRTSPWLIGCGIAAVVGVLVVGGCVAVLGVAANQAAKITQGPVAAAPAPAKPANLPHLGQPATGNRVQLTGLKVINNPPKGALTGATQGHLVAIDVRVKNLGSQPLAVNPLYFKLIGTNDEQYDVDLTGVDNSISTADLSPGVAASGLVAFDLPVGVKPDRIVFTNAVFSDLVTTGLTK